MKKAVQHNDKFGQVLEVGKVPEKRIAPGVMLEAGPEPVAVDLETFRKVEEAVVVEIPAVDETAVVEVPKVVKATKTKKKTYKPRVSSSDK